MMEKKGKDKKWLASLIACCAVCNLVMVWNLQCVLQKAGQRMVGSKGIDL